MHVILLSGGSGKRLWPLSNEVRSKQFLKIFRNEDSLESMVQRMYREIKKVDYQTDVTIATSKTQVSAIHNQIGEEVGISVEPCRRDTFPAIALASAYLRDVQGVGEEEAVVVCPVDPYVESDYFESLKKLGGQALKGTANLVLMGIEPTGPSEKFGYIIPNEKADLSTVRTFKEKPDTAAAKEYIAQGALWNGGVFAYKLGYMIRKTHEFLDFTDYEDLFARYEKLPAISFDYAVAEKEPKVEVMKFDGAWKDLGTWDTLSDAMSEDSIGKAKLYQCEDTKVVNELDVPVVGVGLKHMIVAASPDGVLVSDKTMSAEIKPLVDQLDQQVMFAEKSWGDFRVIDITDSSMTIRATLPEGHRMNYHSHARRDEIWNIISGNGTVIVDGMTQDVKSGDVITMAADTRHTILARTKLEIIEVQIGKDISVHDKTKYELKE